MTPARPVPRVKKDRRSFARVVTAATASPHDRERANFCDFFALRAEDALSGGMSARSDDEPPGGRDAFDALFKR